MGSNVTKTPSSLLERLRQPGEKEAWNCFVELYTPLLFAWANRLHGPNQEAADLVQEVFILLLRKLPEFRYDPEKSFRRWLRTVAGNCWHNLRKRSEGFVGVENDLLQQIPDEQAEAFWETEYRQSIVSRALRIMQKDFEPVTWQAFWECTVLGQPPAEVGQRLGLSLGSVYTAKSRVLSRLRQELDGLLE